MPTRTLREGYQTIIVLVLASLILSYFVYPQICYWVAVILLLGALLSQRFVVLLDSVWMAFAQVIGKISSSIILTLIFFVLLTPLALLSRVFRKESNFNLGRNVESTFRSLPETGSVDFTKPW